MLLNRMKSLFIATPTPFSLTMTTVVNGFAEHRLGVFARESL